jgi:hypothetical protein
LAIRGIGKDEAMVRAADRLRWLTNRLIGYSVIWWGGEAVIRWGDCNRIPSVRRGIDFVFWGR